MRNNTSMSEAMIFSWKQMDCSLQIGGEYLSQVTEFKYISGSKIKSETDRQIGAASSVMWTLFQSVVVNRDLASGGEADDLSLYLHSNPHLWSWAVSSGKYKWWKWASFVLRMPPRAGVSDMSHLRRPRGKKRIYCRDIRSQLAWERGGWVEGGVGISCAPASPW